MDAIKTNDEYIFQLQTWKKNFQMVVGDSQDALLIPSSKLLDLRWSGFYKLLYLHKLESNLKYNQNRPNLFSWKQIIQN